MKMQTSHSLLHQMGQDNSGSVMLYSVFVILCLLGGSALVVDYGRSALVKHDLQNYADAAAMAGASYLDGSANAIGNATSVVNNTISKQSLIADGQPNLQIEQLNFYSSLSPKVAATSGSDAQFLEVQVRSETVTFIFAPLLSLLTSSDVETSTTLQAKAVASGNPTACGVPPLMICDYTETMGSSYDVLSPSNYGKQIKLGKASGMNTMAPGNFGVLDTPDGSQASQAIAAAMAAVDPPGCYGNDGIDTAPGARADAVRDGINARFDMPAPPQHFADPAPNVINYPRDDNIDNSVLGSGTWDIETYWSEKHPDHSFPNDLPNNASRYQVYLYELGETYAYSGKKTLHPFDPDDDLPYGYTLLQPANSPGVPTGANSGENDDNNGNGKGKGKGKGGGNSGSSGTSCDTSDSNCDGIPENNPPVDDPNRRVMQVVVLNCVSDNVKGNGGPYPSHGKYIEMFVTESVGQDITIYGEIVRRITPKNSSKLHSNVSLNE